MLGKWKIYLFWPKDCMFICPTEIAAFAQLEKEFDEREAQLLGRSIDSEWVHHAWRNNNPELKDVPFPMLSRRRGTARDVHRESRRRNSIRLCDHKQSRAQIQKRFCACWTPCSPRNFAPATGTRASRR